MFCFSLNEWGVASSGNHESDTRGYGSPMPRAAVRVFRAQPDWIAAQLAVVGCLLTAPC